MFRSQSRALSILAILGMASNVDSLQQKQAPIHARSCSNQRVRRKNARQCGRKATSGKGTR